MKIPKWQNNALMISFICGIWITATGLGLLNPYPIGFLLAYGISLMITTIIIAFVLKADEIG